LHDTKKKCCDEHLWWAGNDCSAWMMWWNSLFNKIIGDENMNIGVFIMYVMLKVTSTTVSITS
jgi:hypothetical protein